MMKKIISNTILMLSIVFIHLSGNDLMAQNKFNEADTFPVPPVNDKMLFYLQRTHNSNTVIYELNYKSGSTLDEGEPLKSYWIRYTEPGKKKKELSYTQRKFAYGLNTKKKETNVWSITMVAYDGITLTLKKGKDSKFHVYTKINGKESILDRVYVKMDGGSAMSPNIPYIELYGHDTSGKQVYERIKPKK